MSITNPQPILQLLHLRKRLAARKAELREAKRAKEEAKKPMELTAAEKLKLAEADEQAAAEAEAGDANPVKSQPNA